MRKMVLLIVCGLMLCSLLGCETFKGVAQDVENTGKNIGEVLRGEK